jgi:hypothetical protein
MSNPGPATTVSIHPSNLATNQALRVIAVQKGVNLANLGDVTVPVLNSSSFAPATVVLANANASGSAVSSISSVYLGVYSAPSKGGTAVLTDAALSSNTTTTAVTAVAASTVNLALNTPNLYVNIATATATGTVDVYVYGYDLS